MIQGRTMYGVHGTTIFIHYLFFGLMFKLLLLMKYKTYLLIYFADDTNIV